MAVRSLPKLIAFLLLGLGSLSMGGLAFAQEPGDTSGTSAGKNVQPSTAIQKELTGRSSAGKDQLQGSSNAAGAPGMEGKPGAQSGPVDQHQMTLQTPK